ncbi:MAG: GMC family oxidoreductase N-terminal domain-containing protein, partial [Leadbetterella sp.]
MDIIKDNTFEAIVIGSGISGGWAAKELCDKGVKTLMLERGRKVDHIVDYPTTMTQPWEYEHRGKLSPEYKKANPIISKCYAFYEGSTHFFVKDKEHPYVQDKPFDWIRGYQVGGKGLMWARQTQRWSQYDFDGPARDGFAVEWPISYEEMAPWYSYVEKFAGIAGNKDGIPHLPDGEFLRGHELNCVEDHLSKTVKNKYNGDRHVIIGRCAHLTDPQPIHTQQGRAMCQHRTICERGCPYGGYFSSNASTIPWAMKTGNLTMKTDSVVHSIIYDDAKGKAKGVRVIDAKTKQITEYYARIIFVNAAALNTNLILLNSTSSRFQNGLGNDNGLLGKYVAFHNYRARVSGSHDGFAEFTTDGKRPTGAYIPRFRNVYKQETDFLRGYAVGVYGRRIINHEYGGIGTTLKDNLHKNNHEGWHVDTHIMGETIPKESSYV